MNTMTCVYEKDDIIKQEALVVRVFGEISSAKADKQFQAMQVWAVNKMTEYLVKQLIIYITLNGNKYGTTFTEEYVCNQGLFID